jgi:uncharacterized protein involved in outer membrane biogenesis
MKRVLVGLLLLIALAIAAVALSIDRIAGAAIERQATRALGVETRVGFVRLSPLDGELKVSSLTVANPPGFAGDHFLAFDEFELKTELRTLRSDVVHVPLFRLEGVDLSLERRAEQSNTDAILANLKRFEKSGHAPGEPPPPKGPERRFVVSKLAIRDITAHVEWNTLVAKQSALEVHLDGIELDEPGGSRGLTLAELSNVVVKAVLESVRRSGQLPLAVASDLAGGLRGLAKLPVSVTGGVLEQVGELLPGPAGEAVGGAVEGVGDAVEKGIGKLFGREAEKQPAR